MAQVEGYIPVSARQGRHGQRHLVSNSAGRRHCRRQGRVQPQNLFLRANNQRIQTAIRQALNRIAVGETIHPQICHGSGIRTQFGPPIAAQIDASGTQAHGTQIGQSGRLGLQSIVLQCQQAAVIAAGHPDRVGGIDLQRHRCGGKT